ncbi:fructosamine kinase family protein [Marinicella sp. W31]|uniref:fructosamine kinase family protein n=1 Tax=Marinicella sp. W31 TaxID=3023713 RepID=UPI003757F962
MNKKRVFIKRRPDNMPADYLIREADGLARLSRHILAVPDCRLRTPRVELVDEQLLHLEYIESVVPTDQHMQLLGKGLATFHQPTEESFGLEKNNFIGLSRQHNTWSDDWGRFFVEYRLQYQIECIKNLEIREDFCQFLESHRIQLVEFLNRSNPQSSLLHGDLWSGNVLFDDNHVWLIDPATYYGDREVDLAMTEMFGGFSEAFYKAYDMCFPRSTDYHHKKVIYNLYHYLNHYNLFGSGYLPACYQAILYVENME